MQFGATPVVGCVETVFSLKTMLQTRRENNVDSRALFADSTKACDSAKHEVASLALKKWDFSQNS